MFTVMLSESVNVAAGNENSYTPGVNRSVGALPVTPASPVRTMDVVTAAKCSGFDSK